MHTVLELLAATAVKIAALISGSSGKTTPADADTIGLVDSADGGLLKKLTIANLKAAIKSYLEGLSSIAFSGSVSAGIPRVEKPAGGTLTAEQCRGYQVGTKGQTDNATLKLAAIAEGMHGTLAIETTVAKYYRLDPQDTEIIRFDGTVLTAGYYVGIVSAVAGGKLVYMAEYSGTTLIWDVRTVSGLFAAQA